jgi:hypothetical protein
MEIRSVTTLVVSPTNVTNVWLPLSASGEGAHLRGDIGTFIKLRTLKIRSEEKSPCCVAV